jgi:protein involved in polysaccharide export with SLBB domain
VQFLGFRQVTIVGAVSAPGDVYRTDGMRVYDLLIKAGGLRFDAYHEKISIQRRNLDGTFGPIIFVNADKAAKGDPKENVELQDRDLLQVYSVRDFNFIPEQKVQILGAVQRPGIYPFGKDMRVRDLIQLSGNFLPNTFLERGFIQRRNLDGTVGPLYIIDLNKVLSDDPQHNLALQLNDEVSVYTKEGADYIPNQLVSINGAIQKPGTFPFAPNMKVRDLLQLAGNVTPEASLQRAFVQRRYLDGTVGPLYQIDLNKAYKDDPKHNLALQTHDEVTIFTKKKADYLPPQEVIISGAVQAPGTFPRSEGMKLKDLLLLAGGTLPNADDTIEIAHPRRPVGSPILRISLKKALAEDTTQNIVLEDGDTIAIKTDKNILISPFRVTVLGSVNRSGDFPITERTMRLSTFFKRVNGFLPNSAPKYALLARRPEYLTAEHQTSIVGRARNLSQLIQADAYKRAVSRAEAERAQQLVNLSNYVQRSNATSILNQAGQAPSIIPTELLKTDPATPARPLRDEDLQAPGTIPVNLEYVLKHPGSAEDLVIRDGDIITIPEKPANVTVVGAVTQPSTILFREGASLGYYLAQSGGRNIDADPEQALVIRMNGRVLMANKAKVELGDIIFIPTRVMAAKLPKTQSDFDRWFGVITNGVLSYAILRSIIK